MSGMSGSPQLCPSPGYAPGFNAARGRSAAVGKRRLLLPVHALELQPGELASVLDLAAGSPQLLGAAGRDGGEAGEAHLGDALGQLGGSPPGRGGDPTRRS